VGGLLVVFNYGMRTTMDIGINEVYGLRCFCMDFR
jgi:hypothetical protein